MEKLQNDCVTRISFLVKNRTYPAERIMNLHGRLKYVTLQSELFVVMTGIRDRRDDRATV